LALLIFLLLTGVPARNDAPGGQAAASSIATRRTQCPVGRRDSGLADLLAFDQANEHARVLRLNGENSIACRERQAMLRGVRQCAGGVVHPAWLRSRYCGSPFRWSAAADRGVYLALLPLTAMQVLKQYSHCRQALQQLSQSAAGRRLFER
jgi:hypothetical protein